MYINCKSNNSFFLFSLPPPGKSTLIENVLLQGGHNLAMDDGVGRFFIGSKNLLLLHDCDLRILYSGGDAPKFKAIARTETVTAKVHSTTVTIPPLFIMVTSNQKLLKHVFPGKHNSPIKDIYDSDVEIPGNKRQHEENIAATKMRYLELFVRAPPPLDLNQLPRSGTFTREHFILGVYSRVEGILQKYSPTDFHSPFLYLYACSGLSKNVHLLPELAAKYNYNPSQHVTLGESSS